MEFETGQGRVVINTPSRQELFAEIDQRMQTQQGFALATLNLDHLVKLNGDSDFAQAYAAQDLIVADGNPIVWLSRLAGKPVDLVPGADLVVPLAQLAAQRDVAVALLGSTEDALAGAQAALEQAAPGVRVVARIAPPMGFDPDADSAAPIYESLSASGAGLCFLALGAPKQERLAARGRKKCPQIGFVSIGAGLDFLAGTQNRAPAWVRRFALEWVWRMVSQPARLVPRYAKCIAILPRHTLNALRQRAT